MSLIYKNATISDCQKYRYALSRTWDCKERAVLFIALNPSTADEKNDDPTIRRCIDYAKNWGYGILLVVNLFAYRTTNPEKLRYVKNPVGNDNDQHIIKLSKKANLIVAAWGNKGSLFNRLLKEIGLSLINGLALAFILVITGKLFDQNLIVSLTIGGSMMLVIIVAALVGTFVPIVLDKRGIDPAIATGPFVTTSIDVLGVVLYFLIASLLL